jgi:serine O-acetyltransferase
MALDRLEHCFRHIAHPHYSDGTQARFDPLHSDQYCHFLFFLSWQAYTDAQDEDLAKRLFYLNKILHAFNCMYDTALPDVFWLIHVVGTVLGKARYRNHLVVRQNCTVGAIRGDYPDLGNGLILSANTSVIGRCRIGQNVMLGPGCTLVNENVPDNTLVLRNPKIICKPNSERALSTHFYH